MAPMAPVFISPEPMVVIIGTADTGVLRHFDTITSCPIITDEWAAMDRVDAMVAFGQPVEHGAGIYIDEPAETKEQKEPKNDNEFTKGGQGKKGRRRQFMRNHK